MIYSLDTNSCIRYINGRSPQLRAKIPTVPAKDIIVSSVVRGELFFGAAKSQTPAVSLANQQRFLHPYASLPFDDAAAAVYATVRAALEKSGTPIGSNDMLIAAIALTHNLILVTHNTREFSRIPNLRLEDWEL
jgi:tRNA(fMet)-specific endonuclease VapC